MLSGRTFHDLDEGRPLLDMSIVLMKEGNSTYDPFEGVALNPRRRRDAMREGVEDAYAHYRIAVKHQRGVPRHVYDGRVIGMAPMLLPFILFAAFVAPEEAIWLAGTAIFCVLLGCRGFVRAWLAVPRRRNEGWRHLGRLNGHMRRTARIKEF